MKKIGRIFSLLLFSCLLGITSLSAETFYVSSEAEFDNAHSSAVANDTILWRPGTYFDIDLDILKDSIYVSAEVLGETIFSGFSKAEIRGDYVTFRGFQYVDGDIGTQHVIDIRGSHVLFTQVNITGYECYKYLIIRDESQYVDVTYSNFENRRNLDDQNILSVLVDGDHPGFNRIRFCSFKNFDGEGGDFGIEPIRIGVSTQGEFDSRTLVEYCYFTQCNGDGEIISNKAEENVFRYNTFDDNPMAELVLRHGSDAVVYGNFFLNGSGGIRVREGQNYFIFNNYFQYLTSRSIFLQNDPSDPLVNIHIAFNTFVNAERLRLGGPGDFPPENVTIANNLFLNEYDSAFREPTGNETFIGNIVSGNIGITVDSGITMTDPKMEVNGEGYYFPTSVSPMINAAQPGYMLPPQYEGMDPIDTTFAMDLMQQTRPSVLSDLDIGCSEFPQDVLVQPHVTEENTGPDYDTDITILSSVDTVIDEEHLISISPNPVTDILNITFASSEFSAVRFDIYNSNGKLIKSINQDSLSGDDIIVSQDISDLIPDWYVIYAIGTYPNGDQRRIRTRRFVKSL